MTIQVLHKAVRRSNNEAPCCTDDYYSIDNGDTWITRKEFHEWHDSLIKVIPSWKRNHGG